MRPSTNPLESLSPGDTAGFEPPADGGMPAALRRLAGLLDRCPIELAQSPEDLNAIAWIEQSLEDLEATIIGLSHSSLPMSLEGPPYRPSPTGSLIS